MVIIKVTIYLPIQFKIMPNKTPRSEKVQAKADKAMAKSGQYLNTANTLKNQAVRVKEGLSSAPEYAKKSQTKLAAKAEKSGTKMAKAAYRQGEKSVRLQTKAAKLKSKGK